MLIVNDTLNKSFRIFVFALLSLSLTGCLNLGHLNYKQARMLKKEGFSLTDEGWTLGLPERLLFEFNQSDIGLQQKAELGRLSAQLQQYKLQRLKIVGHTDSTGNPAYNLQLSEKRAQSVSNVFIENGFEINNIKTIGRGATQPLVSNDTEENRASNRRVNVIITP